MSNSHAQTLVTCYVQNVKMQHHNTSPGNDTN
jgi:hypothetical protein